MKFILLILIISILTKLIYSQCSCEQGYYMNYTLDKCFKNPEKGDKNYQELCNDDYAYSSSTGLPVCRVCKVEALILFSENNKCIRHNIPNCLDAYMDSDTNKMKCRECAQNYYSDFYETRDDAKKCKKYPIEGEQFYVKGCSVYRKEYQKVSCYTCSQGYYLDSLRKICNYADYIENCNQYQSKNRCRECYPGFNLAQENTKCLKTVPENDDQKIEGCGQYENTGSGYDCRRCSALYYMDFKDNYKCKRVQKVIENCIAYNSENKCQQCYSPYYRTSSSRDVCALCPKRTGGKAEGVSPNNGGNSGNDGNSGGNQGNGASGNENSGNEGSDNGNSENSGNNGSSVNSGNNGEGKPTISGKGNEHNLSNGLSLSLNILSLVFLTILQI